MKTFEEICSKYTKEQLDLKDHLIYKYIDQFKENFDQNYSIVTLDEDMIYVKYPNYDYNINIDVLYEKDYKKAIEVHKYLLQEAKISDLLSLDYIQNIAPSRQYCTFIHDNMTIDKDPKLDLLNSIISGRIILRDKFDFNIGMYEGSYYFNKIGFGAKVEPVYYTGVLYDSEDRCIKYYEGKPQKMV